MQPLIEIESIPIEIEMRISNARLEYTRTTADIEISRDKGGLSIKSRPIKVNLDTFEARSSVVPTTMQAVEQSAEAGKQSAYETTATYARQGQLLLKTKIGQELITQFAKEAQFKDVKTNVGMKFIPTTGPDISWDGGELNIRYQMDKLNFDWKLGGGNFEFIPGDITFEVTQQPDVVVRYIGGPIYIPPSADPKYEESIDVKA